MKCPVCTDVRMREVEKDGVMIDICPDCKGVWLDRGELDKLMQGIRRMQDEYDRFDGDRGYEQAPPPPPVGRNDGSHGGAGYPQGRPSHSNQHSHYDQHGYDKYGYNKHGYDKYGKPRKKKSMFDVLGDLFD